MVNFRFHLVSIVAVFLALALGIGMGATVIDQATVDQLRSSLDSVRNQVNSANERSDRLQTQLDRSSRFEDELSRYATSERLNDVDTVVIGVRGTDEESIDDTIELTTSAGASVAGTLWFTGAARLDQDSTLSSLRQGLATPGADANQLRQAVFARVSAVVAGAVEPAGLDPLFDAEILEWEGRGDSDVTDAPFGRARVVFASGARPEVSNEQLARPLLRLLAAQPVRRVVVVEAGRVADDRGPEERGVFISGVRGDDALRQRVSTVDDIDLLSGRVATVLALSQLPDRTGDYGVATGAGSQIPGVE